MRVVRVLLTPATSEKIEHDRFKTTPPTATIVVRPHWLARLFGAQDLVYELEYDLDDERWVGKYTRDPLSHMSEGTMLRRALEAQPAGDLPTASTKVKTYHVFNATQYKP